RLAGSDVELRDRAAEIGVHVHNRFVGRLFDAVGECRVSTLELRPARSRMPGIDPAALRVEDDAFDQRPGAGIPLCEHLRGPHPYPQPLFRGKTMPLINPQAPASGSANICVVQNPPSSRPTTSLKFACSGPSTHPPHAVVTKPSPPLPQNRS